MITFSETKSPTTQSQIAAFEELIGVTLPADYKEHLLNFNGGRCSPNMFEFVENGRMTTDIVDRFLALHDGPYSNLLLYAEDYKLEEKRMPGYIVPIAHDPGGNLICISCGEEYGSVYFWNHEEELEPDDEDENMKWNLYFIAPSFTEFLQGLKLFNA